MRRFRLLALVAALVLLAAACGSSDDGGDDAATEDTTETAAADASGDEESTTTEAPAEEMEEEEEAAADEESMEEGTDEAGATAPEGSVPVSLTEFVIGTSDQLATGTVTFFVTNDGEFPHEFGITKGDAYENLPQVDNGAIDEEALGADLLGKTAQLEPGDSTTIDFDLEAGEYVLFCNVAFGPNSHAANGQVLSATAS